MKTLIKLTDQNMQTHNGFQWELNKWYKANGKGGLCTDGCFHGYDTPELAVLLNPIHADFKNPRGFTMKYRGEILTDNGLKVGVREARIVEEITLPVYTDVQKIAFGILCAKEVCKDKTWNEWADNWLNGTDRTEKAARAAWAARAWAAWAAARAAWAAWAAWARAAAKPLNLQSLALKAKEIKYLI